MREISYVNAVEILIDLGIKQSLIDRLDNQQIINLATYVFSRQDDSKIKYTVLQLISLELFNKQGATILVQHGIATIEQIKELDVDQIKQLIDYYQVMRDEEECSQMAQDMVLINQQHKILMNDGYESHYAMQISNIKTKIAL